MTDTTEGLRVAEEVTYLVRLADWAAGQGFCQLPDGMDDPEEWCFRIWRDYGNDPTGNDYTAANLARIITDAMAADKARIADIKQSLVLFPEAYDVLTRQEMKAAKGNLRSLIDQQAAALTALRAALETANDKG